MQRCALCRTRWVTHSAGEVCLTCERDNRPVPDSTMTGCPRCKGAGRLPRYHHIAGGRCGLCGGKGRIEKYKAARERPRPETPRPAPPIDEGSECFPSWREKYAHRCGMGPPPMERVPKASYEDVTRGDGEPGCWNVWPEKNS